jgi:hypothetical protein
MSHVSGSYSSLFVLNPSTPKTTGGNLDLAYGQVGLFSQKGGNRGALAVNSIANTKNEKFFLAVGGNFKTNKGGFTQKSYQTFPFLPKDVVDLTYSAAKAPVQSHVYLGYDGINKDKSLLVPKGAAAQISLKLTGEYLSFLGFRENQYEMAFTLSQEEIKNCEDECTTTFCKNYTLKFIEKIQDHMVREGVKLKDILEIHPVISCFDDYVSTVGAYKWKLTLCDTGDDAALGLVQAQAPANSVVARVDRDAANSTYEIVTTTEGQPTDFQVYSKALLTDCGGDCPEGYEKLDQETGLLYNITLNSIIDESPNIEGEVSDSTVVKVGLNKYALISPTELSDDNIAALIAEFPNIQIDTNFIEVKDVCVLEEPITIAWVENGTCNVATTFYSITLDRNDCDADRLPELEAMYPSLEIEIDGNAQGKCADKYVTEVISNVVCDECHPDLFRFEKPSAFEFTEWKKEDVEGIIKTATYGEDFDASGIAAGTYTVTINGAEFQIVVDENDDEEGVIIDFIVISGGSGFETGQTYEIQADGKDDNNDFAGLDITVTGLRNEEGIDCVCGISFKTKDVGYCPEKHLADRIGTMRTQMEVEVSGGEILGHRIGYDYKVDQPFPVTRVSRAFNGTGWGHEFEREERESIAYNTDVFIENDNAVRSLLGVGTLLEPCKQYDVFTVQILRSVPTAAAGYSNKKTRYKFVVPNGSAHLFKSFFNIVASGNADVQPLTV